MADVAPYDPACSLEAHALRERKTWIAALNRKHLRELRRTERAVTLIYDSGASDDVKQMIIREKECCDFLAFDVRRDESALEVTITVPEQMAANADALLAPFTGTGPLQEAGSCCGTCSIEGPAKPVHAPRLAGAAIGSSAAAVLACGACCVLPLMFPGITASVAGGTIAWLAGAHRGITIAAAIIVVVAWLWVWRASAKRKAGPAIFTLAMMSLAALSLVTALAWPRIEAILLVMLNR